MQSNVFAVFEVNGTSCALRTDEVAEFLPLPRLSRPPSLPRMIAGFLNLAGTAIPVIDMDALLGSSRDALAEPGPYAHLILTRPAAGQKTVALLVKRVSEVISSKEAPQPVSDDKTLNGCVSGIIEIGSRSVHILASERLLLEAERQELAALTAAAQVRLGEWHVTH
ncbi:hypothetical protein GCM10007276_18700 [Agaricicola taiwanensis]|uniref:CheW-like domain-containing protein n=2 Tax=Agaricicola taiwanensis TaxID=591372 RepID=A0A8J2YGU8_9RHOB|nr:hypothetical protein GCM10007276_18700 [Agaricicola taiwanensis]